MIKRCGKCKTEKPLSEFNKNSHKNDGLQGQCRECQKESNNSGYITNPNRKLSVKNTNKVNKDYNTKLMRRYKRFCGCKVCGEREPVALDLHHVDPTTKDYSPASLVGYSTETMKKEFRKCIVLCATCHRKVHAGIIQISYKG